MGKQFEYRPKHEDFTGTVVIEVPNYKERMELARDFDFDEKDYQKAIDMNVKVIELVDKHLIRMSIKHKKTKKEFNSFEDLQYFSEGTELLKEFQSLIFNGPSLGNDSKPL